MVDTTGATCFPRSAPCLLPKRRGSISKKPWPLSFSLAFHKTQKSFQLPILYVFFSRVFAEGGLAGRAATFHTHARWHWWKLIQKWECMPPFSLLTLWKICGVQRMNVIRLAKSPFLFFSFFLFLCVWWKQLWGRVGGGGWWQRPKAVAVVH